MIDQRRREYLEVMGIQLWERRRIAEPEVVPDSMAEAVPDPVVEDVRVAPEVIPMDWDALAHTVMECTMCELHKERTQAVFGVGAQQADWMIVGEAPGVDEDHQGEPFVGRAGKLLNLMLQAVGLQRQQVYIANIVKCRPPGNRDPRSEEAASCRAYLDRQMELVQPKLILAVGRIAAQNLLATDTNVGKLRGRVHRYGERQIPLVVTYHPAYLLRSPAQKVKAWSDLQLARGVVTANED